MRAGPTLSHELLVPRACDALVLDLCIQLALMLREGRHVTTRLRREHALAPVRSIISKILVMDGGFYYATHETEMEQRANHCAELIG